MRIPEYWVASSCDGLRDKSIENWRMNEWKSDWDIFVLKWKLITCQEDNQIFQKSIDLIAMKACKMCVKHNAGHIFHS